MGGWEVNPNLNMGVDQLRKAMIAIVMSTMEFIKSVLSC